MPDRAPGPQRSGEFTIDNDVFAPIVVIAGELLYLRQTSPATGENSLLVLTRATARSLGGLLLEFDR